MQLHELIDREDPRCLYCKSDFKIELDSGGQNYTVEILTCRKCKEIFEIHSEDNFISESKIISFLFSCKNIYVRNQYDKNVFHIGNHQLKYQKMGISAKHATIPAFEVDFSDKKKLYQKFRVYLTFS